MSYIDIALSLRYAGSALPFVTVRVADDAVIGYTCCFNLEYWTWSPEHVRHGLHIPDVCKTRYTWLSHAAMRTSANIEVKLLMLTHAFETWRVQRVCFHSDARNQRIGAGFESTLCAHRLAADHIARDSARYSIVEAEWPIVKERLGHFLDQRGI